MIGSRRERIDAMRSLQAARVSNQRATTDAMTGTTGNAGPNGMGIDRTGITDHLALTFFPHLVFRNTGRCGKLVTGSVPETEGIPTTAILPAPIRSAQRILTKACPLPIE